MTADFRALCAELAHALDNINCNSNVPNQSALVERALTVLAQSRPPADGEVADTLRWPDGWSRRQRAQEAEVLCRTAGIPLGEARRLVRDARDGMSLQDLHDLIGHAIFTPQPPADDDVAELVALLQVGSDCGGGANLTPEQCHRAAALLLPPADGEVAEVAAKADAAADADADADAAADALEARAAVRAAVKAAWKLAVAKTAKAKAAEAKAAALKPEVAELANELSWIVDRLADIGWSDHSGTVTRAAELLQRQATLQPIPATDRLPAAADCDAERRCWQEEPGTATEPPAWNLVHRARVQDRAPNGRWLPAHAMPQPSGEVEA